MRQISLVVLTVVSTMSIDHGFALADEKLPTSHQGSVSKQAPVWQAEQWVLNKTSPWLLSGDDLKQKKNHKGPVRTFAKAAGKGVAKELGTSAKKMSQDMVFVFSAQDINPYEKKGPPLNRSAIVLKFTLVDGSSCYLRRFPDGSYAIEDGFADGTVLLPEADKSYLVKYPNGAKGRLVRKGSTTIVHRPDKTTTTISKTASGGYTVRNSELGYMGSARPDRTGVHYELGEW